MSDVHNAGGQASFFRRLVQGQRLWLVLGGLVLLVAALGAWRLYAGAGKTQNNYIMATVQRGDIEDLVSATGSLQPRDYVDVGAQVSGLLRKLHVQVGSEVREGDLLAEIDAETSIAKVDASRAQLRSQQAQLAERELALVKAERDLQRQKNLMAEEATTAETLQNAETALQTARAQIQSLKAQMEQLRASTRVDEANLKFTKIYAPMAGTVASITARQGQTLNANQAAPTLLRIADLSVMTVQTQVSEADVSKLRMGMPVYFTTLGSQGRRWYGDLKRIEPTPTVTNNVVLYNALFEVPNANRSLMTQMTAQVFFVVAEARDVLVVPMAALTLQRGQGPGRERGPGAGNRGESGNPPAAVPAGARPVSSLEVPATGFIRVADQATPPAGAGPRQPRMDREAFQKLSEEERERLREQWRKEREAGGGPASPAGRETTQNLSEEARQRLREQRRKERESAGSAPAATARNAAGPERKSTTAPAQQAGPGAVSTRPEGPGVRTPRGPRPAKVKVMAEDGQIEEREVTIGISNRVHAEVLSGLKEGERVIAGVREPEGARRSAAQGTGGQGPGQQGFGGPGMPGGPMPGGTGGGARR